jgi:HlyD family secretion protein
MKKLPPLPWIRIVGVLVLLAALGAAGWTWKKGSQVPAGERYRTLKVERGSITQTVSANGTLNPVVLVSVGTQVSGTVLRLHADFNQRVEKGQVLAELDPALLAAAEKQSLASVASAEATLKLALANEERLKQLFEKEYISRQEMDQGIQIREAAQAQVQLAKAQLDRDRTNLRYSVIRSPVSGVVVDRQIDVGQTVAASFQTPTLFKIAQDLKQMQIDSSVAEADVGAIRVGQEVPFRVDAFPDRAFAGKVRQIRLNPTIASNVVTYNVVVEVANPDETLLPGMTAYITVVTQTKSDILMVPNAALRFRPAGTAEKRPEAESGKPRKRGGPQVYVLRSEGIVPVEFQAGITNGRYTEALGGGLAEGDSVVIEDLKPADKKDRGTSPMRMF